MSNEELSYRIRLLLPMSCSFTNKMEKKITWTTMPTFTLFPELNQVLWLPQKSSIIIASYLNKMMWLMIERPDEPQLILCCIHFLGTQAKKQISRAEMQVIRCCFLWLISVSSSHLTHTFSDTTSSPIFGSWSQDLWRLIPTGGDGGFLACWQMSWFCRFFSVSRIFFLMLNLVFCFIHN